MKFKRRKAIAQKKLEDEKQNLIRVTDILSELEKQVGPLERQSEEAKEYLRLREELRCLDANLFLAESEELKRQIREVEQKEMILTGDQESVRAESETLKSEYELLGTELDALDATIAADREACSREDLERQEKTGRIGVLREQIRTEQMNEEHIRSRMASIDGEMHQKEEEQAEYESEKQALNASVQTIEAKQQEAEAAVRSLDERSVLAVLHGNEAPAMQDIRAGLVESLENPIGAKPLREEIPAGARVALVVSDMSRFWMRQDLVIPHLVAYLHTACGVPYERLTIVVANGTHLGGSEQELRTLVTPEVFDRVKVENHDCEAKDLVYLGTTAHDTPVWINHTVAAADFVVCLGACTHHIMAGFGGGRKSILPGVSGLQTIRHNHAYSLDPGALRSNPKIGNGVLEGNPLHEDMCEAAAMLPHLFMVNLVMNAQMQLCAIFSGHYLKSWEEGCRLVNKIYQVDVPEQADAIVTSCGGFPKDISLYQGTKTIDNVESGLKPGGTLILMIEAPEGGGPEEYFGWCKNLLDGTIEQRLREAFTVAGYIFFQNCEQAQRQKIFLYSSIPDEQVRPMGMRSFSDMTELLKEAKLDGKSIYVIPNGATVVPHVC